MSPKTIFTLVFLRKEDQILLCLKNRGMDSSRWTGYGGSVEPTESIVEAAIRELYEESDIKVKPSDLINVAHLEFFFHGQSILMEVRVFIATTFEGTPKASEDMTPRWFNINNIPYIDMWHDDELWFPYLLAGKKFVGKFYFEDSDTVEHHRIEEVESLEMFDANIEII